MTALRPLETARVRAVASERYPLNSVCAHPSCTEPAVDPHHAWPRSFLTADSWFVEIELARTEDGGYVHVAPGRPDVADGNVTQVVPHVTGLCRAHHDDVEEHRAWIKLEGGVFVWYDRTGEPPASDDYRPLDTIDATWESRGPLNPQPGSREGKPKRRPHQGQARRQRLTITMKVPKDAREDGAGILDDLYQQVEERLGFDPPRPIYFSIVDSFSFLLANADETDVGG